MKQLKIYWKKELKNCVSFFVYINGTECGIIQRGDALLFNVPTDYAEVYLVPKAPKWFGWKALKIQTQLLNPYCEMHLAVQVDNGGSFFGALGDAANINNQLHCTMVNGIEVCGVEYIKKYK
ncbi:MAG: hypothetical protein E7406_01805 [Ruminococcaceae bacterium]|nr:hypothetical protein [Oscillospiraceae bacterium]